MAKIFERPYTIAANLANPSIAEGQDVHLLDWSTADVSLQANASVQIFKDGDSQGRWESRQTYEAIGARISNLKAWVDLQSFPEVDKVALSLSQDEEMRNRAQFELDKEFPYGRLEVWLERDGSKVLLASPWIQNKRPGYWISLDRLISNTGPYFFDFRWNLGVTVWGGNGFYLTPFDVLTVYGELTLLQLDPENQLGIAAQ